MTGGGAAAASARALASSARSSITCLVPFARVNRASHPQEPRPKTSCPAKPSSCGCTRCSIMDVFPDALERGLDPPPADSRKGSPGLIVSWWPKCLQRDSEKEYVQPGCLKTNVAQSASTLRAGAAGPLSVSMSAALLSKDRVVIARPGSVGLGALLVHPDPRGLPPSRRSNWPSTLPTPQLSGLNSRRSGL